MVLLLGNAPAHVAFAAWLSGVPQLTAGCMVLLLGEAPTHGALTVFLGGAPCLTVTFRETRPGVVLSLLSADCMARVVLGCHRCRMNMPVLFIRQYELKDAGISQNYS